MLKQHNRLRRALWHIIFGSCFLVGFSSVPATAENPVEHAYRVQANVAAVLENYCLDCHAGSDAEGGVDLERLPTTVSPGSVDVWERVLRKLAFRQMPPIGEARPDEAVYRRTVAMLSQVLDQFAAAHPRPSRVATFRRLTRAEYENAVRDLLGLRIDAAKWLPKDESSHGFDNITVQELSPTLISRYLQAAEEISRKALGRVREGEISEVFRIRGDVTQERHRAGLPIGTRGGAVFPYDIPLTADYEFQIKLTRDRNEHVEGLHGRHELHLLIDDAPVAIFEVKPPPKGSQDHSLVDAHLRARVPIKAGRHRIGAAFVQQSASLIETMRQPYQARFNMHRHPRTAPAILQLSLAGPFNREEAGYTGNRPALFGTESADAVDSAEKAFAVLSRLAARAWRRPVSSEDLEPVRKLFRAGVDDGGLGEGMERAVAGILASPRFLFRIERDPLDAQSGSVIEVPDFELASRLSFFLWSSIPDDELLAAARAGRLGQRQELLRQVERMLADSKADALVESFASQWLYLRNLDAARPDMRKFPDFDHNLRVAMRRETELLFRDMMRRDRSVLALLQTDSTYVNERLARHYGIPHVLGDRFRKVEHAGRYHRGGILRHASVLTVTSYATRTSPVLRGQWVLKNVLGSPPPPPPANVPALKDNSVDSRLTVRERLEQHRANIVCARCHDVIDPVGLALENFDAIGRWRTREEGRRVDSSGGLPDGRVVKGIDELEIGLIARPDLFATVVTERLITFALGRGVLPSDASAIRRIVRDAAADDYRFSALIKGIVVSEPFLKRTVP